MPCRCSPVLVKGARLASLTPSAPRLFAYSGGSSWATRGGGCSVLGVIRAKFYLGVPDSCSCYGRARNVFFFHFADILLVGSATSVTCYRCVIATCVTHFCLLYPVLLFGEHPACRIHARLPFIHLLLYFLHGSSLQLDEFLLQGIIRACGWSGVS